MSQPIPMPVFGSQQAGLTYHSRLGAYGVVSNPMGQVAVLDLPDGCFLPGGALRNGETHSEALLRELGAQLAQAVEIHKLIAQADEYFTSQPAGEPVYLQCNLYLLELPASGDPPASQVSWLPPAEAIQRLSLACHAWAVREVYE
ncbi:MAG: NUDIX domain-containing protein [Chloroflexi bacterium]|nr:NUDIX domain-containing protein [Chloroflexota bacterium]